MRVSAGARHEIGDETDAVFGACGAESFLVFVRAGDFCFEESGAGGACDGEGCVGGGEFDFS